MPSLLRLPTLHFALIRMLRRIEDVHRPLAADSALDNDWQVAPNGLRHGNEDAGIVKVLLVLGPADTFLVALLCSRTFLQWKSRKKQQERGQEDEANAAGVKCCVGATVRGQSAVAGGCDGHDVDGWNRVSCVLGWHLEV